MTEVVALTNIPGLRSGHVAELNEGFELHVAAGNAVILPDDVEPDSSHTGTQLESTISNFKTPDSPASDADPDSKSHGKSKGKS